jgi:hypothetical protein
MLSNNRRDTDEGEEVSGANTLPLRGADDGARKTGYVRYLEIRAAHAPGAPRHLRLCRKRRIRQHTSADVSIRQHTSEPATDIPRFALHMRQEPPATCGSAGERPLISRSRIHM